eukprot:2560358-Karenia_brevis.AAC.1
MHKPSQEFTTETQETQGEMRKYKRDAKGTQALTGTYRDAQGPTGVHRISQQRHRRHRET